MNPALVGETQMLIHQGHLAISKKCHDSLSCTGYVLAHAMHGPKVGLIQPLRLEQRLPSQEGGLLNSVSFARAVHKVHFGSSSSKNTNFRTLLVQKVYAVGLAISISTSAVN